jgi:hypothetical protein
VKIVLSTRKQSVARQQIIKECMDNIVVFTDPDDTTSWAQKVQVDSAPQIDLDQQLTGKQRNEFRINFKNM